MIMAEQSAGGIPVLVWNDILVVIDDGKGRPFDYKLLQKLATERAQKHSAGIGVLTVIPKDATPPSAEARAAMNEAINNVLGSLRCLCYLVEGTGFQGAMVRAVLTGMRFLGQRPYATHVSTDLEDALGWMLGHLGGA